MTQFLSQSVHPEHFFGRNFMFVPIETPSIYPSQGFGGLIILSGVVRINFAGDSPHTFRFDQVILDLDVDFGRAIHLAPYKPQSPLQQFRFAIAQAVPFATVNTRAQLHPQPNADDGTAVNAFFSTPGGPTIQIDVGVLNNNSAIFRLGYHLSLYGHLVDSPIVAEASTAQADAPADSIDPDSINK